MNNYVREGLITMLCWQVGINTDFRVSIGKSNKYLKEYIDEKIWNKLMNTFNMGDYKNKCVILM